MAKSFVKFSLDVAGVKQFHRGLEVVDKKVNDFSNVWEAIADDFYITEKRQFAAEGGHEGNAPWRELSEPYKTWKAENYGTKILHLRGILEASLTKEGAPGNIHKIDSKSMTLGTGVRVGKAQWSLGMLHQEGTKKMPARPPIQVTTAQAKRWSHIATLVLGRSLEQVLKH